MGVAPFSALLRWLASSRSAQAASGSQYVPAPRDGSLTLPEVYNWHYQHNPHQRVFLWHDHTGPVHLTYSDVIPAAQRAARYVAEAAGIELVDDMTPAKLVVILAASDTVTYATTLIGLSLAGIPVFPITPRFSASVVSKLVAVSGACHIFVSGEAAIQELAQEAVKVLSLSSDNTPGISIMPSYDDLYRVQSPLHPLPSRRYDPSALAIITHSSGSTSFPKPIPWSVRCTSNYSIVDAARDYVNEVTACPAIELFHAWGIMFLSFLPMTGYIMAVLPPSSPAVVPTADAVYQCMTECRAAYALAPPSLITQWSCDLNRYPYLRQMKGIVYGGRFLSRPVGDLVVKNGVRLHTAYGTTETGLISTIFRATDDEDWEYFEINSQLNGAILPNNDAEQSYRLVVTAGPTQALPVINSEIDGKDAHVPGDSLLPHPNKPGYWKVLGRVDDQIMLSTGEIVYPSSIESQLCQDERIKGAVMFGRGQSKVGVVIELDYASAAKEGEHDCVIDIGDMVMPVVERVNAMSPPYARIDRRLTIFAHESKPFTYSLKGTPRRALVMKDYQPEIEAAFQQYNAEASQTQSVPLIPL
ncbi:uncharacterized protein B0H18DRAFT_1016223 [Fomitopsis serialis]|uniref:uncharacterized protein n=1 Tax=Fomitopsis serialis TaxID=139415 RepID=UPI002007DA67|nr:uncharacterized protein B0H18DRAFT_1016223 [Neoantrodia serialis]KAH9922935.1 hypothetical protein B0H18DRAFT_1016223 [Neoantrodia serialis]